MLPQPQHVVMHTPDGETPGAGLQLIDLEQRHESIAGLLDGGRAADERDDLVKRVERLDVAAQNVGAFLGLAQTVLRAANEMAAR
jgi:hypothetical protein